MEASNVLKVAVADDEFFSRKRLVSLLKEAGCEIIAEYGDGQSVLHFLECNPTVDALFLDIQMPLKTGLDVVREMPYALPVVFVTADMDPNEAKKCPHVVDCVYKPIMLKGILKAIEKVKARLSVAQ